MICSDELKGRVENGGVSKTERNRKEQKNQERISTFRVKDSGIEEDFQTLYGFAYVSDYVGGGGDFELGVWQQ